MNLIVTRNNLAIGVYCRAIQTCVERYSFPSTHTQAKQRNRLSIELLMEGNASLTSHA